MCGFVVLTAVPPNNIVFSHICSNVRTKSVDISPPHSFTKTEPGCLLHAAFPFGSVVNSCERHERGMSQRYRHTTRGFIRVGKKVKLSQ
jgi:hypothetical protein